MSELSTPKKTTFPQIDLLIEESSARGFGVCSLSGATVEVAHAIPGDRVRVELMRKKKRVQKGRLLELLSPSLDRIEPLCQHAFLCGGCTWQTMAYSAQLARKQGLLCKLFPGCVLPMIPCEDPWHYRNKMEFTFSENRAGMRYLGLMIAHAEPFVFNLEECRIASSWMAEVLQRVRAWWEASGLKAYHPHRDSGVLRYLTVRSSVRSGEKMAILNVSQEWDVKDEESFCASVGEGISVFIRTHQTMKGVPTNFVEKRLKGEDSMIEELRLDRGTLKFKVSPSSFFQPNTLQAEKLYNAALRFLDQERLVYDLYCGAGTISLAISLCAERVVGIELNPQAIKDAQENALLNGRRNVQFLQGDVGAALAQLSEKPDAVLVDPPRAGLDERALEQIINLAPRKIVYISCNPLTQAQNIRELIQHGYELKSVQGVDQFPHTAHIETVAFLIRD